MNNITFIFGSLAMGGAERQASYLIKELSTYKNINISVIGLSEEGVFSNELKKMGVSCYEIYIKNKYIHLLLEISGILFWWQTYEVFLLLKRIKPGILVSYTQTPNVIGGLLWKIVGVKKFIWNQRDTGLFLLNNLVEKLAIKNTKYFISNSLEGKKFLINHFGVNSKAIKIIRNGIIIDHSSESVKEWKNKLKKYNKMKKVVMVANISSVKDHITLIQAWKIVSEKLGNKVVLLLAGRFDDAYENVNKEVNKNNLNGKVIFLGSVKNVYGLLQNCNLAVFTSKTEGSPNGLLECMAAGLPVIATKLPAMTEIFGNKFDYLVNKGDVEGLARKIINLIDKKDKIKTLSLLNKEIIKNSFNINSMLNSYKQFLAIDENIKR